MAITPSASAAATTTKTSKNKSAKIDASKMRRRKMGTGTGPEVSGSESGKPPVIKSKPSRQQSSQNQSRFDAY